MWRGQISSSADRRRFEHLRQTEGAYNKSGRNVVDSPLHLTSRVPPLPAAFCKHREKSRQVGWVGLAVALCVVYEVLAAYAAYSCVFFWQPRGANKAIRKQGNLAKLSY